MILDTSALAAILLDEPERARFAKAIADASSTSLSAVSFVELAAVIDRHGGPVAARQLDRFLERAAIEMREVTVEQAHIARAAYRDFGRGSGHPARLNFGDCFSYALAKVSREPLLYKGLDFGQTDVEPALP